MFIKKNFINGANASTCDKWKCVRCSGNRISHILIINFRVEMQFFIFHCLIINFVGIVVVNVIRLARWKWNELIKNCFRRKETKYKRVKCVELTTIDNNNSFCDKFRASGWYNRIEVICDQWSAMIIFKILFFIFVFVAINWNL